MSDPTPLAVQAHQPGNVDATLEFLKRTRSELRMLRRVRVWSDRFRVYDINGDSFEITGLGYGDAEIIPVLNVVNTNFKPEQIHAEIAAGTFKEFKTGRRYAWAADRVM